MGQLVKSSISVGERGWMRTGGRPPLLLMLVVVMLKVWVVGVMLRHGSNLWRKATTEAGAHVVREILEQQSTVIGRGGRDASLVKETGILVNDGVRRRGDSRRPITKTRERGGGGGQGLV